MPEKPEKLPSGERGKKEKALRVLVGLAAELGYRPALDFAELDLGEEEIKKFFYLTMERLVPDARFYKGTRFDGSEVKAVIKVLESGLFTAEIFSLSFEGGHQAIVDANEKDLKAVLVSALSRFSGPKKYPKE